MPLERIKTIVIFNKSYPGKASERSNSIIEQVDFLSISLLSVSSKDRDCLWSSVLPAPSWNFGANLIWKWGCAIGQVSWPLAVFVYFCHCAGSVRSLGRSWMNKTAEKKKKKKNTERNMEWTFLPFESFEIMSVLKFWLQTGTSRGIGKAIAFESCARRHQQWTLSLQLKLLSPIQKYLKLSILQHREVFFYYFSLTYFLISNRLLMGGGGEVSAVVNRGIKREWSLLGYAIPLIRYNLLTKSAVKILPWIRNPGKIFLLHAKSKIRAQKVDESAILRRMGKSVEISLWIRNPGKNIFKIRRSVRLVTPSSIF